MVHFVATAFRTRSGWSPRTLQDYSCVSTWPEGFDPASLPPTRYRLGERVTFRSGRADQGLISQIVYTGGRVSNEEHLHVIIDSYPNRLYYGILLNSEILWMTETQIRSVG